MKLVAALFLALSTSFILLPIIGVVEAHSNLRYPLSYHEHQCNARLGCAPCPRTPPSKKRNTVRRPAATWARGQSVVVEWHRNNHLDGFYRRTLVPVAAAFNATAHKQLAFDWGCWTQGSFECRKRNCGGDNNHLTFSGPMSVPKVLRDGDYMFIQTWFGGSDRSMNPPVPRAQFSNFAACSHVRIQGGSPLQEKSDKVFTQGNQENERPFEVENNDSDSDGELKPNQCWSTATRVNQCGGGIACKGTRLKAMTPDVFTDGKKPRLTRSAVQRVFDLYASPTITPTPSRAFAPPLGEKHKGKSQNIMSNRKGITIEEDGPPFAPISSPPVASMATTTQPPVLMGITQPPPPLPTTSSAPSVPPSVTVQLNTPSVSSTPTSTIPSFTAHPSILPIASSSPSASLTPTMSPSPSSIPIASSSSSVSSTPPSENAPLMLLEERKPNLSPSYTPSWLRGTSETSAPLPSQSNDGNGEKIGRKSFSIVTAETWQGSSKPSTQKTPVPSVSNVPVMAVLPSPQPSSNPWPTTGADNGVGTLWTSAESRWKKQCGMYRACIEYCEVKPSECII